EIDLDVEFLFKEVGAALGIAQVFGGVAAGVDLQCDAAALERRANLIHALAMRVVEAFGDTQNRGQAARGALVVVVERGVSGMVAGRLRLAVVIAHDRANHAAVAALQAGNVAIQRKVFAVLVVAAMADAMPHVVQQRAGFELHTRLLRQVVHGLKLIEQHEAEFAHVFGVLLVVLQAAAEIPRREQHAAGFRVIAVRLLARKGFVRGFLQQAFADAHAGNDEAADIEVARDGEENDGGDGHDVGAVAAHAIGFHAVAEVALQNVLQALAKQCNFDRGESVLARARRHIRQRFGISAKRDGDFVGQIQAVRQIRFQQRAHIAPHLLGLHRMNYAGNIEGAHKPYGADRKLHALDDAVVAKDAEFQAAAAEIHDAARLRAGAHGRQGGNAAEARFFLGADHFQANAGGLLDAMNEDVPVLRFAGGAGGNGAILRHTKIVHDFAKAAEGLDALIQKFFAEAVAHEDAFAQPQRIALRGQRLDVQSRIGAGDGEADRIGAGVDGGDVDRLRHDRL